MQCVPCYSRGRHCCVPCTIAQPFVSHRTLGCGPSNLRRNTLECSHPRVFCVIPGAHISVACVPSVSHRSYTGHWDVAPPFETGRLEWDYSKVFHVIPGASIPVSHVLWVGHRSHTGHWGVGPATRDGPPWNRIIPRRSVSFQGPTSPCAMYYQPVIDLTQNPGMWGHSLKTEHPGMG